jgi:Na+-transporting NADH:ubiquinone oxidoreductase subunit A
MTTHTIKKGFDIRIEGVPEVRLDQAAKPLVVGVRPTDFPDLKARVVVKEGDQVSTGDVLFFDKRDPDIRFLSPATGKVTKVVFGKRRAPQLVEISPEGDDKFAEIETVRSEELGSIDRDALIKKIKAAGLWPLLRQRPVGKTANADKVPVAIYVNGMDTEPLAADPAVACMGQGPELAAGIDVLRHLTSGKIHISLRGGEVTAQEFHMLKDVDVHRFEGPHPSGLVGTHIDRIAPLKDGEVAWFLKAQEAVVLGAWVLSGHYPAMRTVAVSGSGASSRQYFRVRQGASLLTLTGGKLVSDEFRVINGTVLNGEATDADGYLGFYANTVTILPEGGDRRDLFGWALPQFGKHSASRAVMSWLLPKKIYDMDTRLHGGPRAIVNIGAWERVMPLDIHPTYLVRAIQAGDIEEALSLGLLEVTEEDVALCTFVDPCKIEVGDIIRKGLDMYEEDG